jgi:branched-chain amino acid transport system substrate-binding protein
MSLTRRGFALASAGSLISGLARPARAAAEPIRIGFLAPLTGAASGPTRLGFQPGIQLAVDDINAAGGVLGRKIDLITRDTQSDPTKAVNAAQELIAQQKVHVIVGPMNSGETLASTPILARAKMPNFHPCYVDSLIDPVKYPNGFRVAPRSGQLDDAVRNYVLNVAKIRDVAVMGDTTGYGTSAVASCVAGFKASGANVLYQSQIDAIQPNVKPDLLRAQAAGAKFVVLWSVSAELLARLMNERAQIGWDVPFIGHPSLGSGEVSKLLDKPANWEKVYTLGFRTCAYNAAGKLPPRTEAFVTRLHDKKVDLSDTVLYYVLSGYDLIALPAAAIKASGGTDAAGIIKYVNSLEAGWVSLSATYKFSPTQHNGLPTEEIVMVAANSVKDGAYTLAPGYSG